MLDGAARTAQQAADALGVQLGQIAKSIVFRRLADGAAVLLITSGDLRVDEAKVAAITGPIGRADASFVKRATGFSIGGVSPVAIQNDGGEAPILLIDERLNRFDVVWAAAGHPHGVFQLAVADLASWTGQTPRDVTVAS